MHRYVLPFSFFFFTLFFLSPSSHTRFFSIFSFSSLLVFHQQCLHNFALHSFRSCPTLHTHSPRVLPRRIRMRAVRECPMQRVALLTLLSLSGNGLQLLLQLQSLHSEGSSSFDVTFTLVNVTQVRRESSLAENGSPNFRLSSPSLRLMMKPFDINAGPTSSTATSQPILAFMCSSLDVACVFKCKRVEVSLGIWSTVLR